MLSPNQIRQAEFDLQFRGYDRDQVDELLEAAALALEATRNDAMTIERRFRAAAARVQELTAGRAAASGEADAGDVEQDHRIESQMLVDQIAQLERRRDELEEQIAARAAMLRADQDRLGAIADSLRTLADRRFGLDADLDVGQDPQSAPASTGSSPAPESSDDTGHGSHLETAPVAAAQMITGAGEPAMQGPVDPGSGDEAARGVDGVDEPGPNPR